MPVDTTQSSAGDDTAPEGDAPTPPRRRWAMDTRPLRRPAYRRLWSSTIVTAVGSQLTAVAVPKRASGGRDLTDRHIRSAAALP
jgi:hypothetical protein